MSKITDQEKDDLFNTHYRVGVGSVGGKYYNDIFTPEELESIFSNDPRVLARHIANGVLVPVVPEALLDAPTESGLNPDQAINDQMEAARRKAADEAQKNADKALDVARDATIDQNPTTPQPPDPQTVAGNTIGVPDENLAADGKTTERSTKQENKK